MSWFDRLKTPAAADGPADATLDAASAAIVERLRRFVSEHSEATLRPADVDARENLFDAGYVDSLSATELVAFVNAEYGVHVRDMDLLDRCNTLVGLAAFILAGRAR